MAHNLPEMQVRVCVVGCGISGAGAAAELVKAGHTDLVVVEAMGRAGGRVHTAKQGSSHIELGAHWIHGEDNNCVYEWAMQHCPHAIDKELDFTQTGIGQTTFVNPHGEEVPRDVTDSFQDMMVILDHGDMTDGYNNLAHYYQQQFSEHNKWGSVGWQLLDWHGRFQSLIDGSDSWHSVSAATREEYWECSGNLIINWNNPGYQTLVDHLLDTIGGERVLLNSPVSRIEWGGADGSNSRSCSRCYDSVQSLTSGVQSSLSIATNPAPDDVQRSREEKCAECGRSVEEASGSRKRSQCRVTLPDRVVVADHVIFSGSLGVLKATARHLFQPSLPDAKLRVIDNLGFDTVAKIYLEFSERWWPEDCNGFSFLSDLTTAPPDLIQSWEEQMLGFYTVRQQPLMLIAWICGPSALAMERTPLPEVIARCATVLQTRLAKLCSVTKPVWGTRSVWGSNPYTQGSYSFRSCASDRCDVWAVDLAQPLPDIQHPVLCFCGEATHEHYYSTVHGAWESGKREAARLMHHWEHGTSGPAFQWTIGATDAEDGFLQVTDSSSAMKNGSSPMQCGSSPMKDGSSPMKDGSSPMKDGSSPMKVASSPMKDGSLPMKDSVGSVCNGDFDEDSSKADQESSNCDELQETMLVGRKSLSCNGGRGAAAKVSTVDPSVILQARLVVLGGNLLCLRTALQLRTEGRTSIVLIAGHCPAQQAARTIAKCLRNGSLQLHHGDGSCVAAVTVAAALQMYRAVQQQLCNSATQQQFISAVNRSKSSAGTREVFWLLCWAVVCRLRVAEHPDNTGDVKYLVQQLLQYFSILHQLTVVYDNGALFRNLDAAAVVTSCPTLYSDRLVHRIALRNKNRVRYILAENIITEREMWIIPSQHEQGKQIHLTPATPHKKLVSCLRNMARLVAGEDTELTVHLSRQPLDQDTARKWYFDIRKQGTILPTDRTGAVCGLTEQTLQTQGVHLVSANSSSISSCLAAISDGIAAAHMRLPSVIRQRVGRHHAVVVVGAGAAALGAVTQLNKHGITDILLLEGSSRVGGRVHTLYPQLCSASPVELGAQWVHGQTNNVFYESIMLHQPHLISNSYSVDGGGLFVLPGGRQLPEEIRTAVSEYYAECEEQLEHESLIRREDPEQQHPKLSVGDVFQDDQLWHNFLNSQPKDKRDLFQSAFDWHIKWYLEDNACSELGDLSVAHWGRYEFCKGEENINPAAGMTAILNSLYQQTSASIRLNTTVLQIRYSSLVSWRNGQLLTRDGDQPAVTIFCSDGEVVGADAVIATPSIGHMQANPQLFSPPLPVKTQQAIDSMGFGVMDKIILEYSEAWWNCYGGQSIQLVWPPRFDGEQPEKWEEYMSGFDITHGATPRLTGWIAGRGAVMMESCSEQEIATTCTQMLRNFLARDDIPMPCSVYRSQWASNQLFCGTYSNPSVLFEERNCSTEHLNTPVTAHCTSVDGDAQIPVLVLAGEANSYHYFSTVHGAMENGMEQARHIIQARNRLESNMSSKL